MTDPQPTTVAADPDERPTIVDLVRSAAEDGATLVREEIELAKAELRESAQRAGTGAGMFAAAGFLAFTAWFVLTFAAAFGLVALGLPVWAGMLIVAVVYLLIAGVLGMLGRREVQKVRGLERTQESVTTTVEQAKAAITPAPRP